MIISPGWWNCCSQAPAAPPRHMKLRPQVLGCQCWQTTRPLNFPFHRCSCLFCFFENKMRKCEIWIVFFKKMHSKLECRPLKIIYKNIVLFQKFATLSLSILEVSTLAPPPGGTAGWGVRPLPWGAGAGPWSGEPGSGQFYFSKRNWHQKLTKDIKNWQHFSCKI